MKKLLIIVSMLISTGLLNDAFCINPPNDVTIIIDPVKRPRPENPDTPFTVHYSNGNIDFEIDENQGMARLLITRLEDMSEARTSFMTCSFFSFYIGTTPGSYQIEIETETGGYYTCLLEI